MTVEEIERTAEEDILLVWFRPLKRAEKQTTGRKEAVERERVSVEETSQLQWGEAAQAGRKP
jgi:hypothetical protein